MIPNNEAISIPNFNHLEHGQFLTVSYFLPPEWAQQKAVMLTWPHANSDWGPLLPEVEPVFVEIARQIVKRANLIIVGANQTHLQRITSFLPAANCNQIHCYQVSSDDTWARDHGPITVFNDQNKVLLDFTFNGWGNKFSAKRDNQISKNLHSQGAFGEIQFDAIDFVLEGGSIEVDGQGTLLTTEHCLLAKTRNPLLNKKEIETLLTNFLGIKRFLWLTHGFLQGDDTDSHIDTLARFANPQTICYVGCDDPQDEHYAELKQMAKELKTFSNAFGNPYQLIELPWPSPKFNAEGQRLPASYANFLIINGAVLVPTYRDAKDAIALHKLRICFPQHEIIAIDCLPLIAQGGSLHCVTMQIP